MRLAARPVGSGGGRPGAFQRGAVQRGAVQRGAVHRRRRACPGHAPRRVRSPAGQRTGAAACETLLANTSAAELTAELPPELTAALTAEPPAGPLVPGDVRAVDFAELAGRAWTWWLGGCRASRGAWAGRTAAGGPAQPVAGAVPLRARDPAQGGARGERPRAAAARRSSRTTRTSCASWRCHSSAGWRARTGATTTDGWPSPWIGTGRIRLSATTCGACRSTPPTMGCPRSRQRVFVVAFRRDLGLTDWHPPTPTHAESALLADQASGEYWERHGVPFAPRTHTQRAARADRCV